MGDNLTLNERRIKAVNLRRAGVGYRGIARELGVAPSTAWRLVDDALRLVLVDGTERLRQIEGERLDDAQRALWPSVLTGDVRAIDAFVRLSARRARMFGLDLEAEHEVDREMRDAYREQVEAFLAGMTVTAPPSQPRLRAVEPPT
jgi:hypothetical protein